MAPWDPEAATLAIATSVRHVDTSGRGRRGRERRQPKNADKVDRAQLGSMERR